VNRGRTWTWVAVATSSNWPAVLVAVCCVGLALANWISLDISEAVALAALGIVAVAALDGRARVIVIAAVLAVVGLAWGSLRIEAIGQSVLAARAGDSAVARLVTTGAARPGRWTIRVPAEVETFAGRRLHERVLLTLPVGRSPPRGAIVEADVRVTEPRPEQNGFDERAWLARRGIHVVLEASAWWQVGRRGGIAGLGDRLRDHVESSISRGTTGPRRSVLLGVVLGEDEELGDEVQREFRASGLYHLLRESTFSQIGSIDVEGAPADFERRKSPRLRG
jgi:predicted membrane metal-binding protein